MIDVRLKNELLAELQELRRRIVQVEERISLVEEERKDEEDVRQRSARLPLSARIEFIGDFDLLEAEGIDQSETGICFELGRPLPFDMQFVREGDLISRRARLIWVKQLEGGRSRLGLRFVDPDDPDSVIHKVP